MIAVPQTSFATRSRALVYEACPPHIAAHVERSYRFAALLAEADDITVDHEVLYIGVMLHDIGLADRFHGNERFEVAGANGVRIILRKAGMDGPRAEMVWDVIALHASSQIARHKSAETAVANAGISIDIRGTGTDRIAPEAVREVLDEFPREGFPIAFQATLVEEVRRNPDACRLSWLEPMAVRHVDGYKPIDFETNLLRSNSFR